MKKVILSLAVACIATASISAQQAATARPVASPTNEAPRARLSAEDKAKRRTDKLTTICGLSAEQAANIQRINVDFYVKQEQLRSSGGTKEASAELAKNRREREDKVLTPEQLTKLKAYNEQKKQNQTNAPAGSKPDGAGHEE